MIKKMTKKEETSQKEKILVEEQKLIKGRYETECSKVCGTAPYTKVSYMKYIA